MSVTVRSERINAATPVRKVVSKMLVVFSQKFQAGQTDSTSCCQDMEVIGVQCFLLDVSCGKSRNEKVADCADHTRSITGSLKELQGFFDVNLQGATVGSLRNPVSAFLALQSTKLDFSVVKNNRSSEHGKI